MPRYCAERMEIDLSGNPYVYYLMLHFWLFSLFLLVALKYKSLETITNMFYSNFIACKINELPKNYRISEDVILYNNRLKHSWSPHTNLFNYNLNLNNFIGKQEFSKLANLLESSDTLKSSADLLPEYQPEETTWRT